MWLWWDNFDMKLCGKWKSEEFEINNHKTTIFLNIEFENDETGVKVNFSYDNESYNNTAFYVESSYDSLYLFHNDREHRAEYILTLKNDDINIVKCAFSIKNCYGLKDKLEKEIEFKRVSSVLTEEDLEKFKPNNKVEPKNAAKIDILKEYAEYGDIKSGIKFEFKFDERENMSDIIEKYKLDELVKGKSDVETAIALLNWFCGRYKHGDIGLANERTPQALIEFADKNDGKTNCRGLALVLAQLIRAYNIKAFHTTCSPYENPFDDCHVVICVYCESISKWIFLDPSNNLYLKNKDGEIISLEEFRDIIIAAGELFPNEDWHNNWAAGIDGSKDCPDYISYRDYMAKNLIRLERYNISRYGNDGEGGRVILIPEKYMRNEAKNFKEETQKRFITSKEDFWQV